MPPMTTSTAPSPASASTGACATCPSPGCRLGSAAASAWRETPVLAKMDLSWALAVCGEIFCAFATSARLKVTFEDAPLFSQLLQDVESGRCQVGAAAVTVTDERKARFAFSLPYFPNRIVVVQKTSSGFAVATDLKDRRLAMVKGTLSVTLAGKGLSLDSVIEWLEQLLARAKRAKAQSLSLETFARAMKDQAAKGVTP